MTSQPMTLRVKQWFYSFGLDNAIFTDNEDGTASIVWDTTTDDAGMYNVTIGADDGFTVSEQSFNLNVVRLVNDPPVSISTSKQTLGIPAPAFGLVAYLDTNDADGPEKVFSLVSGDGDANNDEFAIYGNTLVTASEINGEGTKSVRIKVSDSEYEYEEAITITLTDSDDGSDDD